jgi:uncharacterized HhH-GPD family protein
MVSGDLAGTVIAGGATVSHPTAEISSMPDSLHFTENAEANELLANNPLALLIGMLLDQQFPMERAFLAPFLLADRLDGPLDAATVTNLDDETLAAIFKGPPALHRFPGSMGTRARDMCAHIVEHHNGDAAEIWRGAADGGDLYKRLRALPGFGEAKSRTFIAVVGKRLDEGPPGWEEEASKKPSIADVDSFEKIFELREIKRAAKAAKKAASP